jgi:ADP-ribose pyrophosphatase
MTVGGRTVERDIVRHPGAVTIIPMVDDNHVCLIRNFRIAVEETLLELPAGTLEPDEDPQTTATRELLEETGFRAGRIRELTTFYLSPGVMDEKMRLYLATDLVSGDPQREAGEQIENHITPWHDALAMVRDGRIRDAKTIVGLLLYDMLFAQGRISKP